MARRLVILPVLALFSVTPQVAAAQQVQWLGSQGDASGSGPNILFAPLRLSLLSDPPQSFGCESVGSATATSPGLPSAYIAAAHLVPNLSLVGFANHGCARDASIGGGLVYTTPIRPNIWLVGSAGFLSFPHANQSGGVVTRRALRLDVVFDRGAGRSYSVGVSPRGLMFGGLW
jgi:hypothetical protein